MPARMMAVRLAALLLLLGTQVAAADAVKLVTPLVYGTHLPGLGEPALRLSRLIKRLSGGTLVLELKQPGEGAAPHEILDQVSRGSVDAGVATASFWSAKIPAAPLFSGFPFGPDAQLYADWLYGGNGRKLYQQMYDQAGFNVHVIPCAFGGGETAGWFAKEITSKADLDGLRIRAFGLGQRVLARLGAKPVLIRGSAVADAFAKGKIDAAELYTPAIDQRQGLHDKVKRIYMPGWHQPETVLELLVNKDKWKALDEQQRALIETACQAIMLETLVESSRLQADALAELAKQGVSVETWSQELQDAFRNAWTEVAKQEGERDAFFRDVLDDLEQFRSRGANGPAPPGAPAASPSPTAP